MAIPIVCAVLLVITVLIMGVSRWQAHRIKATGASVNSYSALQAAEAGVHLALAEIRANPTWATHRLEIDRATGATRWAEPLRRPILSAGDPTGTGSLKVDSTDSGLFSGTIGTGLFKAQFKVRAGPLPLIDDPTTPSVDESNRYIKIEALGLKKDNTKNQDRATKLEVIVERTNFTEFVLYDGDEVVLGMGSAHDRENANIFADGWIYGRNRVHLGDIGNGGTRQLFVNLGKLVSDGPIFVWNPFQISFQDPPGTTVTLRPGNDSRAGRQMETARGNILDGTHRKPGSVPFIDETFYRRKAKEGGIDISSLPAREETVRVFDEEPKILLDFGLAGFSDSSGHSTSGLPSDDAKALGREYPPDFNGLLYSDKPLAVWGSPDRDLTIFCTKDVFICGDFNARTRWRKRADSTLDWVGHRQNYKLRYEPKGSPPVEGSRYFEYRETDKEVYVLQNDATTRVLDGTEERKAVAVISLGHVWFDMRHPSRVLANELRPYVKMKIVEAIAGESEAYEYLKDSGHPRPFTEISLKNQGKLGSGLADLFDLRRRVLDEEPKKRLYLTTSSYEKVARAFEEVLIRKAPSEDEKGVITKEKLEGTPASPGLVDLVLDAMCEDEDRFTEYSYNQDSPPPLAIWSAPQGLYDLVYDERKTLGPQGYGRYSDWGGDPARDQFTRDELFMPQITINAMVYSQAARNDPGRSVDPTDTNRRFYDLGNGVRGVHFLSSQAYMRGDRENVISPIIQRFVGSDLRLATVKNVPPVLENGFYWPSMRRRIYDPSLPFHPPPLIVGQLEIVSYRQRGATADEFQRMPSSRGP